MREIRLRAFAKINYALDVIGLRLDGYHEVRTVLQSISLSDGVGIERIHGDFELSVEPEEADIGPPVRNTAYIAWKLLRGLTGEALPARVKLRKMIPAGAGLGGGSADAAAVLVGLNEMFELGLRVAELRKVGAKIGADVPFCISGGTALGEGVGDVLTPLPVPPTHRLVLVKPGRSVDTGKIYRAFDAAKTQSARSVDAVISALRSKSLPALAAAVGNDLASVTRTLVPDVATLEQLLVASGASGASMSGSGTAVYGVFDDEAAAESAKATVDAPGVGVFAPVPYGVEIA